MLGDYERVELETLEAILEPGMHFVDVGANIGIHTVVAARAVGTAGKVFSFEPFMENFDVLKANVEMNALTNVQLEMVALGAHSDLLPLSIDPHSIGTHTLVNHENDPRRTVQVPVTSLDEYFEGHSHPLDVVKIDVEGFEPQVLAGGKHALASTRHVLVEVARVRGCDPRTLLDLLADFPYAYIFGPTSLEPVTAAGLDKVHYANLLVSRRTLTLPLVSPVHG